MKATEPKREPEAPPVGRPTTRPGGRGSRSAVRPGGQESDTVPSEDVYEVEEISEAPIKVVEPIEEVFEAVEVKQASAVVDVKKETDEEIIEEDKPVSILRYYNIYICLLILCDFYIEQRGWHSRGLPCEARHHQCS